MRAGGVLKSRYNLQGYPQKPLITNTKIIVQQLGQDSTDKQMDRQINYLPASLKLHSQSQNILPSWSSLYYGDMCRTSEHYNLVQEMTFLLVRTMDIVFFGGSGV